MYTPDPDHRKNSFAVLKGVSFLCYTMPFKLQVFFFFYSFYSLRIIFNLHFMKLRYMLMSCVCSCYSKVLADIPISQRLDILIALITNTDSSSMVILLLAILFLRSVSNTPSNTLFLTHFLVPIA